MPRYCCVLQLVKFVRNLVAMLRTVVAYRSERSGETRKDTEWRSSRARCHVTWVVVQSLRTWNERTTVRLALHPDCTERSRNRVVQSAGIEIFYFLFGLDGDRQVENREQPKKYGVGDNDRSAWSLSITTVIRSGFCSCTTRRYWFQLDIIITNNISIEGQPFNVSNLDPSCVAPTY